MPLSPADRAKLAKLLGMLGSDFSGEIANAGRLANKIVKDAGETWDSILVGPAAVTQRQSYQQDKRYREPEQSSLKEAKQATAWLKEYDPILSEWEKSFLSSMTTRKYPLTDKQKKSFDKLEEKIANYEACRSADW